MPEIPTRQKILIGIMVVSLGWFVWDYFLSGSDTPQVQQRNNQPVGQISPATQRPAVQRPDNSGNQPQQQASVQQDKKLFSYTADWKNDPFYRNPRVQKIANPSGESGVVKNIDNMVYSGIMRRKGKSYATINGNVYVTGQEIDQFVIKNIDEHRVLLQSKIDGKTYSLQLKSGGKQQ